MQTHKMHEIMIRFYNIDKNFIRYHVESSNFIDE